MQRQITNDEYSTIREYRKLKGYKWKKEDYSNLRKAVNRFNKRVDELIKETGKVQYLPKKFSYYELKDTITTKTDLNKTIKMLDRFQKKGQDKKIVVPNTEKEIEITRWEYNELNRLGKAINKKRDKRKEQLIKYNEKSGDGKLRGEFKKAGMGRVDLKALDHIEPIPYGIERFQAHERVISFMNESRLDYYKEKDYVYKKNVIGMLRNNFKYKKKQAQKLANIIEGMSMNKFMDVYHGHRDLVEFAYSSPEQEKANLEQLYGFFGETYEDDELVSQPKIKKTKTTSRRKK